MCSGTRHDNCTHRAWGLQSPSREVNAAVRWRLHQRRRRQMSSGRPQKVDSSEDSIWNSDNINILSCFFLFYLHLKKRIKFSKKNTSKKHDFFLKYKTTTKGRSPFLWWKGSLAVTECYGDLWNAGPRSRDLLPNVAFTWFCINGQYI